MNIFVNICLGLAAFLYLVPLQLCLREPRPTGEAAMGLIMYFFITIPLGFFVFIAWCGVLAQSGFSWLGGGRAWQLLLLVLTAIAFTTVISIAAVMRGDPQIPWSMRPLMPWGIYVLPLFVIAATATLTNTSLAQLVPAGFRQSMLIGCSVLVLASSTGMIVEWIISSQKQAARRIQAEQEFHDSNIARIVAEVEALDPLKDLGRLFEHAGANRHKEPRELARKKILTHPNLQAETVRRLGNEWVLETLSYLEANDAPDPAALAEPVHQALTGLVPWVKKQVDQRDQFYREFCQSEISTILGVAEKYSAYGVDYRPVIRDLRAVFNRSKLRETQLAAPAMIDIWLAHRNHLEGAAASK